MWGEGSATYALLEANDLLVGQGVSLGNDGDQVNLSVKAAHNLDIDLLEPVEVKGQCTTWNVEKVCARVTSGLDKVEAGVDTIVDNFLTVDAVLLLEVGIEPRLDVLEDGLPATQMARSEPPSPVPTASTPVDTPLIVVDKVTETGGIDDSQAESHTGLLNVCGNKKSRVRMQTGGSRRRGRRE
jgi:hypothetical protein